MRVLYFSTNWCQPCKVFKPTVQEISKDLGISVNYVNADYESELVEKHSITSVPTILILDRNDNVVFRNTGVLSSTQLSEVFSKHR